jgi:hypothetical protein
MKRAKLSNGWKSIKTPPTRDPQEKVLCLKTFPRRAEYGQPGLAICRNASATKGQNGCHLICEHLFETFSATKGQSIVNRLKQILLAQPRAQLVRDWALQIPRAKTISFCLSRRPNLSTTGFLKVFQCFCFSREPKQARDRVFYLLSPNEEERETH